MQETTFSPFPILFSKLKKDFRESSKHILLLIHTLNQIKRRQILDTSKLKEFVDDNFKFDKNGRKLSKRVENIVGKGKIARYKQFLLLPQCFQKGCFPGASLCGNGLSERGP